MNAKSDQTVEGQAGLSQQAIGSGIILLVVSIVLAARYLPPGWNWAATLLFMLVLVLFLGRVMTYRTWGVLINARKLMSLSRFQITLWTLLVLSGYFAVVMQRLATGNVTNALDVAIPWEVWALLGISSTSLVGSPLIASGKRKKIPQDPDTLGENIDRQFGFDAGTTARTREGTLYANPSIEDAQFTDMFEGDELKDTALIDIAKLQMFLFTIIVAVAYGAQILHLVTSAELSGEVTLPPVNAGLLTLMGISNTAYLASKGVQNTPTV